jgi:RNA-directed DNA polymerase
VGIWDKLKKAFGGGGGDEPPRDDDPPKPPPRAKRPSGRTWRLTKQNGALAFVAPHGTFVVGLADDVKGAVAALADGAEVVCEGDFVGGSSIAELVVTKIVGPYTAPARVAPVVVAAPIVNRPPAVAVTTSSSGETTIGSEADRWRANEILGLSKDELRKRALKINPYRTAWIGRVDTIPPQSDERTAIIDRGLILRGLLSKEQIDQIHKVGDEWIRHYDALTLADAVAHKSADAAVEEARAKHIARKAEKQRLAAEREAARVAAVAQRRATDIIFAGRGVSARLGDRRAHVEQLTTAGLPVLASPADVARALGIEVSQLRWLCFHADASTQPHYVYFEVAKRSGGTRLLAAPHKKLGAAQRWLLDNVLAKLEITRYAHGFVAQRSTVTNARAHVGKAIVVNLDLKDFFPSITFPRVRGLFESVGYSPSAATLLALIATEAPRMKVLHDGTPFWVATGDRALPQGACTSPAISNLVARKLDRRLAGAAAKLGWTYTRYADDLTFSASAEAKLQMSLMMSRVRAIVRDEGFTINEAKGRVQRAARRQQVTGVIVNDKLGVPREEMRRLRAILHRAKLEGLAAQNRDNRADFEAWLRGKIAYVAMIDPERGGKLRSQLDALLLR